MKALITTSYIYTHLSYGTAKQHEAHKNYVNELKKSQGKWVDIETEHIFDNQYNTLFGRIYDTMIDKIEGDVRISNDVFFVNHPNGKDPIKKVDFQDHLKNKRFLSCYSVNSNYYRISRRSTIEFILVGELIYISNSIGYTPLKKSNLTSNEKKIVRYCAERIINNNY